VSAAKLRLVDARDGRRSARQLTDEQLVSALRADDRLAPGLLWDRCSPAVGRLLAKTLGPGLDIDDLTQEVFARVFVRLPSLRDPSALRPFVLSVAANVLKWELRRRWVGRKVRLSVTGKLPDVQGPSADTEARQALQRCYRIFDSFRSQERMAFVLRYLEGMTIEEVAATLDTSISSAKRWVNRAAQKMSVRIARDPDLRCFFADAQEGRA
jgi:RNA polymerase sigma-70 factor, ECF subfamily